jgi:hypothetical protein
MCARPSKKNPTKIPNSTQICKLKKVAFPCFKNIEILHRARFEHSDQVSQLYRLQILNKMHVINYGIELNLKIF